MSDGQRTVLDPQNGTRCCASAPTGAISRTSAVCIITWSSHPSSPWTGRIGCCSAIPATGTLIRHSVRVADRDATPILEFGERGSEPGQFETPTGVATVGQPLSVEGPYEVDEHTLLLLHFDGNYDGPKVRQGRLWHRVHRRSV